MLYFFHAINDYANTESPFRRVILRTLAYYDIFKYPLTEKDISEGLSLDENTANEYRNTLDHLTKKGIIYKFGDYYSLTNDERYVHQRIKGNMRAGQWMKKAHRFSRLISHFPFVRSVSLSGSLSRIYRRRPDIDYFIITEPNRLWLARTMLVGFKRHFFLIHINTFVLIILLILKIWKLRKRTSLQQPRSKR
ncbi:MAG: hypothetical protein R2759_12685 [Bacteroidales bacterium]